MKLIPSKTQWDGWTLPSKASYFGCVIGILAFIITVVFALVPLQPDKIADQPQLSVNFTSKPYLRHNKAGVSGIEFSYEICVKNSGKNPANRLVYKKTTQTMLVDGHAITKSGSTNGPPQRLVSGDNYCQIFSMSNTKITAGQVHNFIKKYDAEELSIILDFEIEYMDAITGKKYTMREINKVLRGRVEILYPSSQESQRLRKSIMFTLATACTATA